MMTSINLAASKRVARLVRAEPHACWKNAALGIFAVPGALYVEGWLVVDGLPLVFEHGWLEHRGRVIEPTLWHKANARRHVYFPGVRYTQAEVKRAIGERGADLPFVWGRGKGARGFRYGLGGFGHEVYRAAYHAAQEYLSPGWGARLAELEQIHATLSDRMASHQLPSVSPVVNA